MDDNTGLLPTTFMVAQMSAKPLIRSGAIGTAAFAQQPPAMTVASAADYVRDPTRWGSPEIAALFPGFQHLDLRTSGAVIRLRHGGSGPPLLLLHGNPQNHVCWYKIAARLAQRYHVVLPDLRGYGDSSLPEAGANNINFSFRAMAQDMVEVMEQLGHRRYFVAGHDRGGQPVTGRPDPRVSAAADDGRRVSDDVHVRLLVAAGHIRTFWWFMGMSRPGRRM